MYNNKRNSVIPVYDSENYIINLGEVKKEKQYNLNIYHIVSLILLSWLFGFATILCFFSQILHQNYFVIWLPFVIGFFELFLVGYCCYSRFFRVLI